MTCADEAFGKDSVALDENGNPRPEFAALTERVLAQEHAQPAFGAIPSARPDPDPTETTDLQWLDAHGIQFTEEGIRSACALMRHKREQMTDEAWAALRRGPAAYTAYLADQDDANR